MIARPHSTSSGQLDSEATHSSAQPSPVLVSVRDAREEVIAGYGGTLLAVRTLDGCSCDVHARELLLLTGGVASGARALLRAFHGPSLRVQLTRQVAEGVQIRRAVIQSAALSPILRGWRDAVTSADTNERVSGQAERAERANLSSVSVRHVVYLLRVRATGGARATGSAAVGSAFGTDSEHDAYSSWRQWAESLRRSGGAIVLACDNPVLGRHGTVHQLQRIPGRPQTRRATVEGGAPQEMVRETVVGLQHNELPGSRSVHWPRRAGVRVLALDAGRIVSESSERQE